MIITDSFVVPIFLSVFVQRGYGKGKVVLEHTKNNMYWCSKDISAFVLNLGPRHQVEVRSQAHTPVA